MWPLLLVLVSILSPAPARQEPAARGPAGIVPSSSPALRIGGVEISADAYARWLVKNFGERHAKIYGGEYHAVEREARAAGVAVTDAECDARVERDFAERIEKAFAGSRSEWLAELARTRRTEAGVRFQRAVEERPMILAEKMAAIDRVVPEQKILRDWEFEYGRKGRSYELSMTKVLVVVPSEERQPREDWRKKRDAVMEEGRQKALSIRARIVAGEDFGRVARETSDDPETRDHRGSLPRGFRHFGWPASFLDALESMQVGDVSEPLFARGGWWIVRLDGVKETPLDSVRESLRAKLAVKGPEPDEVAAILEPIRTATRVRILPAMYQDVGDSELSGPNEPVMEVDGEPVPRAVFARWLLAVQGESVLQRFFEDVVIETRAREAGITVTEDEVDARVRVLLEARIRESYKGTRESWYLFLALHGRTEESFVRTLAERTRTDLLAEKLLLRERRITPEDVRSSFAAEYGPDGERIEVRWIVVLSRIENVQKDWTREQLIQAMTDAFAAARVRTQALVERARAGEDFAVLARKESDDVPTRENGGLVPGRFRADVYPDTFGPAVERLAVGEVTDPLDYGTAWATFQVVARRKVTFDEVKDELAAELATRRPSGLQVNGYRNGLTHGVEIELLPGLALR